MGWLRNGRGTVQGLVLVVLLLVSGCISTEEANQRRAERQAEARQRAEARLGSRLNLSRPDTTIRTVQLYATGSETSLPILSPSTGSLTLAFDLVAPAGRPLSAYFFHADRQWQRDLLPGEFLSAFERDDVLDYTISRGTQLPYVHYTYRFPNENIGFSLSGNYILRITEQGDREAVLFEMPFYVAEEASSMSFEIDRVMVPGQGYPSRQPIAAYRPPDGLEGEVFNFTSCFVQNNQFGQARCTDRPQLGQAAGLQFFLRPENAFVPAPAPYRLDLTTLRLGGRVERVNRDVSPFEVQLEPDFARFSGEPGQRLNGQTVVSSAEAINGDPRTGAEYVLVGFAFVPPNETPFEGRVYLTGSFNNWRPGSDDQMTWNPETARYEATLLLKQGLYEYQYDVEGPDATEALRGTLPALDDLYTALIYYRDYSRNTDRLVSVQQVVR